MASGRRSPFRQSEGQRRIWLPFEGDRTLSIIISKALLLADDDRIAEPVILRQLWSVIGSG